MNLRYIIHQCIDEIPVSLTHIMINRSPTNLDITENPNITITSPESTYYNAISWVIDEEFEKARWWSPEPFSQYYWPPLLPKQETVEIYIKLFHLHRYTEVVGNNCNYEPGYEKVAIYAKGGMPTHVAKQKDDGSWTSKLGGYHDVRHETLQDLEGDLLCGDVYIILGRRITS